MPGVRGGGEGEGEERRDEYGGMRNRRTDDIKTTTTTLHNKFVAWVWRKNLYEKVENLKMNGWKEGGGETYESVKT